MRILRLIRRSLADFLSICDVIFAARMLRRWADASRAHRAFRSAGGAIAVDAVVVSLERLEIGLGATVQSGCLIHCGGLDWSAGAGRVRLGARSYIGHHCVLYGSGGIEIGDDVLIGPGVIVTSQGHTFEGRSTPIRAQAHKFAPVRIGQDAWIGAGAMVLPGVVVGEGAVVAAGSVVAADVPAFHMVAGVPARVVRERGLAARGMGHGR